MQDIHRTSKNLLGNATSCVECPGMTKENFSPTTHPRLTTVPFMLADRQDFECSIGDRNCVMRNAFGFGDVPSIAKIGTLFSQGKALLASLNRDELIDGKWRSSLMSSMIEDLFVAASSALVLLPNNRKSGVKDARYVLKGTRVGEASHRGTHSDVPENFSDDLELRLGTINWCADRTGGMLSQGGPLRMSRRLPASPLTQFQQM